MSTDPNTVETEYEVDCPWTSDIWRLDHPDFPLDPRLQSADESNPKEQK